MAKSIFKDSYHFDFLMLSAKVKELEIEKLLTQKITDFLLELGKGFAFLGRQYAIEVDNTDYKIDLLFYHTVLHAYVVIELKAGEFLREYVSKLNFYISAIDDKLKTPSDEPTIDYAAFRLNRTFRFDFPPLRQAQNLCTRYFPNIALHSQIKKLLVIVSNDSITK